MFLKGYVVSSSLWSKKDMFCWYKITDRYAFPKIINLNSKHAHNTYITDRYVSYGTSSQKLKAEESCFVPQSLLLNLTDSKLTSQNTHTTRTLHIDR